MKKAMISELKNRLSHYLQFVRKGQPVLVYDRDRLIARIEPVRQAESTGTDDVVSQLEATGVLRPPALALPRDWLQRRPVVRAGVVDTLLAERATGR
jgi:antitoxin (DNA-binding transcriptional repressor) of toxin-antitoxin stability system